MAAERLQKVLAQAGIASRRRSEELITAGRVTVNGATAQVGQSADPAIDRISVDGRPIGQARELVHYAVHKPAGFVSSSRDERGRRSVVRLLRRRGGARETADGAERLWPAGRLDVESEGLLVLTNDGAWANRFLHPRYGIEREYAVLADRPPDADQVVAMLDGVRLSDGPARFLAISVEGPPPEVERAADEQGTWLRVRVGEGRKREVRRIFAAVRIQVRRLVRTRFGVLRLSGLRAGEWRPLSAEEVTGLSGEAPPATTVDRGRETLRVAIDGPSGSGKSTIGHALAQRIGATFVDTGLMYRALTLAALQRGIDVDDPDALGALARQVSIEVRKPLPEQVERRETVLLDGRDVTLEARTPRVDRAVSAVSRHAAVRDEMLEVQRRTAAREDTVMVGRDIGTVVLPGASLKVFLTASPEMRAARRAAEMGSPDRVDAYLAEIQQRDAVDSGRAVAPLRQAEGALVLDTGELGVEACVDAIVDRLPEPSVHA